VLRLISTLCLALLASCATPHARVSNPVPVSREHSALNDALARSAPLLRPGVTVQLYLVDLDHVSRLGETESDGCGNFIVRIDPDLDQDLQVATWIHELAHVLSWQAGSRFAGSHGAAWGVAYSEVYSYLVEL